MKFLRTRRGSLLFLIVFTGLLLVMLHVNIVLPQEQELSQRLEELKRKQQEFKLQGQNTADEPAGISEEQYRMLRLQPSIPANPGLEQLLEDMKRLEDISGAKMDGYQFDVSVNQPQAQQAPSSGTSLPPGLQTVRMTSSVAGRYSQVIRLLDEMNALERLLIVERMEIVVQGEESRVVKIHLDDPPVVCNLILVSYYAPALQAYTQAK